MWKYVKSLKNANLVKEFTQTYGINLPDNLVETLEKNNGGRPAHKLFDTISSTEHVFKSLLSYNQDDLDNIYSVYPILFEEKKLFPIAIDSSGNFICYNILDTEYYLLNHDNAHEERIVNINELLY